MRLVVPMRYLPCDFQRFANLGYAFVNLVDERSVKDARGGGGGGPRNPKP